MLVVGLAAFALEVVGGYAYGSAALRADAWHVLTDMISIVISHRTAILVLQNKKREDHVRRRAAQINAGILFVTALWVLTEGILKYIDYGHVAGGPVIVIAVIGLVLNYIQHEILSGEYRGRRFIASVSLAWRRLCAFVGLLHSVFGMLQSSQRDHRKTITHEAQEFHILWDMVGNIVVIISGTLIVMTHRTAIDAIATIAIGMLMVRSSFVLLKKIGHGHHEHDHHGHHHHH